MINISSTVTNGTAYTVIGPGNTASNSGGTTWTTLSGNAYATGSLVGSPASFSVNRVAAVSRSGTYTVIVANSSGCLSTTTISLTVAATPVTVTVPSGATTICSSQQPISITASTTGGSGSYSYAWEIGPGLSGGYVSYPGNTSVISSSILTAFTSGTAAARYRVQVTDIISSCPSTQDVVPVLVNQTPSVSLSANGPLTCAQTTLTLTATATGGVTPYTYTFSGPGLSPTASTSTLVVSAAQEGSYTVLISAAGCTTTATTTVTSSTTPPGITQNGSTTHVTCNGLSNGALSVNVTGAFPFTLTAGNGLTALVASSGGAASLTGLIAGDYIINITDANGCTTMTSPISVTEPSPLTVSQAFSSLAVCAGQSATLTATPNGGVAAYTYTFTPLVGSPTTSSSNTLVVPTTPSLTSATLSYTVSVTDVNGCTAVSGGNFDLTVNPLPTVSITPSATTICAGQSVDLTATSGTSYSWNNGASTSNPYAVSPSATASYTVTVTDVNGCSNTATATVTVNPLPVISSVSATSVACQGASTGSFTVAATGTGPYTFAANATSNTTGEFTSLTAGTYPISLTDANGCSPSSTSSAVILEPATAITISTSGVSHVLCSGTTGSLTVTATGGTGIISYSISSGGLPNTTGEFTGLAAGSYTVTAGDANGCTMATGTLSLTQPAGALTIASVAALSATCFGASTGAITATATGGSSSYTFVLGGVSSSTLPGNTVAFSFLAAGTYSLTLTDGNGCTATQTGIVVTQATALSLSSPTVTTVLCAGDNTGAISITASGGTAGYTYDISSGGSNTTGSFTGLSAGIYLLTATDVNSCTTAEVSVTLVEPTALAYTSVAVSAVCAGGSTGAVSMTLTGGAGGYSYTLNTGTTNTTGSFTGLAAGSYTITGNDANGCTIASGAIVIAEPSALSLSAPTVTTVACNGAATGAIVITASGGTGGYSYSLNTGVSNGLGSFTGLLAGSYTITVIDANGCTLSSGAISVAQVGSLPTVTIAPASSVVCPGTAASLTATASGGTSGYTFVWSAGTVPATGSVVSATTAIADAGTTKIYSVTVTDGSGCTAVSASPASVSISPQPTFGTLTPTALTVCSGGTIGFSANGLLDGATSLAYSVNGGPASTTTVTVTGGALTFPAAAYPVGSYTITITSLTVNGCSLSPSAGNVTSFTVKALPTVSSLVSSSVACTGTNTGNFTIAAAGTAPFTYSANGQTNSTGIFTGLAAGTYPISFSDASGCAQGSSVTIGQTATPPTVSVSPSGTAVCAGTTVSLTATGSGGTPGYTFVWAGGTSPTNTSVVSAANALGIGSYTVTITDANGCTATQTASVTINAIPVATLTGLPSTSLGCTQPSATLNAGGGASYVFTNSSGTPIFSAGNQAVVTAAGTYSVIATSNGCSSTTSIVISQNNTISSVSLDNPAASSAVCPGGSVSVPVGVTNATGLQWYKDGAMVAGQTSATLALGGIQPSQAGAYWLVATGSCNSLTSAVFNLTVKPEPVVVLTFPSGSTVVGPGSIIGIITIQAPLTGVVFQATGGVSYERFMMIDRINGYEIRQVDTNGTGIFPITRSGPFRLTVTGANGCKRIVEGVIVVAP